MTCGRDWNSAAEIPARKSNTRITNQPAWNLLLDDYVQCYWIRVIRFDVLDAVLAECGYNPAKAYRTVTELTAAVAQPDWLVNLQAYARCVRITRDQKDNISHFIRVFCRSI